jgi:hypothetical protein
MGGVPDHTIDTVHKRMGPLKEWLGENKNMDEGGTIFIPR